jgi:hypothetical protein
VLFWVEYFCPRQGRFWQRRAKPFLVLNQAIAEARIVKPPLGSAQVIDANGKVWFSV